MNRTKAIQCSRCGGHGVVPVYVNGELDGADECGVCGGMGDLIAHADGHITNRFGDMAGRLTTQERVRLFGIADGRLTKAVA